MQMKKLLTLAALLWTVSESMAQLTYTHLNSTKTDSNSNEWAGKLLDGTGTTKWGQGLSTGDPKWIIFKTSSALIPSEYTLTEANDTPESNGRQWKKWKIYGGNFTTDAAAAAATGSDGWVLLDQKNCPSNNEFPISANKNSYLQTDFTMSQAGGSSYRYFKIVVEEIRQSGEYMQMGDFCFKTYITDPTPQVTFTCTAGKKYNNGEGTEKAFDGLTTTKWNTQGGTDCYALFNASAPIYVWGYDIITANDTEIHGRMPKKWTLYGATSDLARDAASGWVELSSYSENSYVQQRNYFTQRFFCDKSTVGTAYRYFRLEIDKPEGDMQISEFQLLFETQSVVTYNWKEGYYDSSTTDRDGETMTKNAVDWQLGEKMEGNNLSGSWITIETSDGKSYPVKSYSFSTHDDGDWNNRAPKTWKVEGSNDNTNWVTIHEVTDADAAARNYVKNVNYTTYEFTPTNTSDAFKYIKLTLNSMKSTGWTQLGEFHVVGANYGCAEHNWTPVGTVAATCTTPGGNESICTVCGAKKMENLTALASHSYVDGFCSVCGTIQSNYMSKNGDYYQASTPQHLKWLAARMDEKEDGNFKVKLTQDIDLNGSGFQGFSIGNSGIIFKGEFDGQGHWLKNFSISNLGLKQVALFGRTENASIHDLGMYKANVSLSANYTQNTAIIVGNANKTTINRVAVTGGSKVSGFDHVGSIAGNTQGTTTISNCYSDAEVNSSYYQAGGFVGTSNGLTLEKSIFLGSVKAGNDTGDVGGFISRIETDNSTKVQNNIMAATSITTGKTNITPLCPDRTGTTWTNNRVSETTTFKSTHNDADAELKAGKTMNFDNLNGYEGKTTDVEDMQTANFYTSTMGWDMTNDWTFHAEGYYPVLKWMVANISNADELMAFASNVNSGMTDLVAQLTGAINMSGVAYTPIGTEANKYAGSFDGKGNVVSNISYTSSTQDHVGLFGYVKNATIQNTVLDGATITVTTKQNTGGLVGTASASTIQKCAVVNSTITGHDHVAAIVANAIDGTEVRNNYSNATIVSDQYQAGGLVGTIKVATIEKNLFVGTVSNPSGDASGLISRIDAAVSPNPEVRNNMVAAPTITGSSTYAIIKADWNDRPVTFADNYTLKSTVYSTGEKILNQKDDSNGKQISWIDATTKDFYETTLGWDFTNDWKFTCGGKYPILKIMADEALPTQDLAITAEAGYATMVAKYDYDFTDASFEAFAVTESEKESVVHLEPVTSAKHGEALLLKKENGVNFTQTATATAQTAATGNLLKASDGTVTGGEGIYALAKKFNGVGFYPVDASVTIPEGKAYLEVATNTGGGGVKAFYGFEEDDATGINEELRVNNEESTSIFNVAGQRLSKAQKGINIVNGKKILK